MGRSSSSGGGECKVRAGAIVSDEDVRIEMKRKEKREKKYQGA